MMMEMSTPEQQRALAQLRVLTSCDDDAGLNVLASVDWDVERAANLIFGSDPAPIAHNLRNISDRHTETFDIDHNYGRDTSRRLRFIPSSWSSLPLSHALYSAVMFPFHLLTTLVRFLFGTLRLPVPMRFTNLIYRLRPGPFNIRGSTDRWIRGLEEETGAICISRARNGQVTVSGTHAGPSTLTSRPVNGDLYDETRKLLPDFSSASYEDILRTCQTEAKVACVILLCEEHDDVAEFKRTTLTDSALVKILYENDILVWGGDVRDQEAWSAAQKLQATTYPFVAFLALQPRRDPITRPSRPTSTPTLTVLSRHQGRCVPANAPTSAHTIIEHLRRQLLPRVTPFLERMRSFRKERDQDRILREEQDRAFRNSARKDRERIATRMALERQEGEERMRKQLEIQMEEFRQKREVEDSLKRETIRMNWRRWARRTFVLPDLQDAKESIRVTVRLPGDRRKIRHFSPTATLTSLYAYVDAQLIPQNLSPEEDPVTPPEGNLTGEAALERYVLTIQDSAHEWWGFKLVLAYPRQEIKWEVGRHLCDVEFLRGGGQIMAEMIEVPAALDGYSSEDSI